MNEKVAYLSIDCEFTSFDMQGGDLISFASVEVMDSLTIGREFSAFLRPRSVKYFTDGAQEIHGISYFKATTFPERGVSIKRFIEWLSPLQDQFKLKVLYYGSWNFDLRWIEETMKAEGFGSEFIASFVSDKTEHINVLKLARENLKHIGDNWVEDSKGKLVNKKYELSHVAAFYDVEIDHHQADSDARATAEIYIKLMNKENIWTGRLI